MTLLELLELLKKNLRLVAIMPIVFAVVAAIWTMTLPDTFTATSTMYVLSGNMDNEDRLTTQDLSVGQMLTNDVSTLIDSARVRNEVIKKLNRENIRGYKIEVKSATTTRVISISVTGPDPYDAANIANAYADVISNVASEVMNVEAVNVIDTADVPKGKSGPPRRRYTLVGAAAGLFAAVGLVVLKDVLNTRVRSSEDVEELLGLPVVGHFPKVEAV